MAVDNYQPAEQTLVPIVRQPGAILSSYNKNSSRLYNSPTPYTDYGSIGPKQPFVYIKASDSTLSRNLTKYDSQALPIGSTIRDLNRIGQFSVTGTGLLFYGKQLLLQQQNAFNETRIYNPLSVLKATAKPGSTGLIDYPQRHLETSGGLLNFFKDSLLSTIGFQTKDSEKPTIDGTATGRSGESPYSPYTKARGGARAGLMRLGTAKSASSVFESVWVTNPAQSGTNGGFLANLGNSLLGKLKSMIPSTNPLGAFGGKDSDVWEFRPEYKTGKDGIYYAFLSDNSGFLKTRQTLVGTFYNDDPSITVDGAVKTYHRYSPQRQEKQETRIWYANDTKISDDAVGVSDSGGNRNNLKDLRKRMVETIDSFQNEANQFRRSAERYSEIKDVDGVSYPSYDDIMSVAKREVNNFEQEIGSAAGVVTLDNRMFAKAGGADEYNALYADDARLISEKRNKIPKVFLAEKDTNQSKDIIFFYFFDLINEVYIPFRATLTSVSDQHSAEWEDISYLGRADRLFLYKGFSRDVNLSFTVYANSAKELIPMWTRINYLTGLVRPSKYTGAAVPTLGMEARAAYSAGLDSAQQSGNVDAEAEFSRLIAAVDDARVTTNRESSFIYPPMITIRVGDMFVDQPCVISSIATSIPDDVNWESYRSDGDYNYTFSTTKNTITNKATTRQLPMKVDISLSLKMLEKERSLGSDDHYGFNMDISEG